MKRRALPVNRSHRNCAYKVQTGRCSGLVSYYPTLNFVGRGEKQRCSRPQFHILLLPEDYNRPCSSRSFPTAAIDGGYITWVEVAWSRRLEKIIMRWIPVMRLGWLGRFVTCATLNRWGSVVGLQLHSAQMVLLESQWDWDRAVRATDLEEPRRHGWRARADRGLECRPPLT